MVEPSFDKLAWANAKPSMRLLSNGGSAIGEVMSSASMRPLARVTGTRSAFSIRLPATPRTMSRAEAKSMRVG
ncbi:hypothetical protein D9M70_598500 [compost metagenome]